MNKPWETKEGKVFCPVNGWDCPYWEKDGSCSLTHVEEKCDDFYVFWEDEIEAERTKEESCGFYY